MQKNMRSNNQKKKKTQKLCLLLKGIVSRSTHTWYQG